MNLKKIAQLLKDISKACDSLADEFTQATPAQPPTPNPPPTPPKDGIQLLVMFSPSTLVNSGTPTGAVDLNVNGTWYNFSKDFQPTSFLQGVGEGVVLNVPNPITYLALRQNQIRKSGLNNDCYGFTTLKFMQKHPDFKPNNVSPTHGDPSYWADSHNGKGQLVERGSINYLLDVDNPTFYQQQIPADWSDSKKFMVWIDGVGVNHQGYSGLRKTGRKTPLPTCS